MARFRSESEVLGAAFRGQGFASILDLVDVFGIDRSLGLLEQVNVVKEKLNELQLTAVPPFEKGEIDTVRALRPTNHGLSAERIAEIICGGEQQGVELKSSLIFDHKRFSFDPDCSPEKLRSNGVLHACLKTISAFLNCGGGLLVVGVADNGQTLGIEYDCRLLKESGDPRDIWQLHLRHIVESRFDQGKAVNEYLSVEFASIEDRYVAAVSVTGRDRLSFFHGEDGKNSWCTYSRQGNRTVELLPVDIEDFVLRRIPK